MFVFLQWCHMQAHQGQGSQSILHLDLVHGTIQPEQLWSMKYMKYIFLCNYLLTWL